MTQFLDSVERELVRMLREIGSGTWDLASYSHFVFAAADTFLMGEVAEQRLHSCVTDSSVPKDQPATMRIEIEDQNRVGRVLYLLTGKNRTVHLMHDPPHVLEQWAAAQKA